MFFYLYGQISCVQWIVWFLKCLKNRFRVLHHLCERLPSSSLPSYSTFPNFLRRRSHSMKNLSRSILIHCLENTEMWKHNFHCIKLNYWYLVCIAGGIQHIRTQKRPNFYLVRFPPSCSHSVLTMMIRRIFPPGTTPSSTASTHSSPLSLDPSSSWSLSTYSSTSELSRQRKGETWKREFASIAVTRRMPTILKVAVAEENFHFAY